MVLWIFYENSGDNAPMFFIVAEQCLHTAKDFSASRTVLTQQGGWGCTRSREGTQPGQQSQTDQRHIPYLMLCSAVNAVVKKEEKGGCSV